MTGLSGGGKSRLNPTPFFKTSKYGIDSTIGDPTFIPRAPAPKSQIVKAPQDPPLTPTAPSLAPETSKPLDLPKKPDLDIWDDVKESKQHTVGTHDDIIRFAKQITYHFGAKQLPPKTPDFLDMEEGLDDVMNQSIDKLMSFKRINDDANIRIFQMIDTAKDGVLINIPELVGSVGQSVSYNPKDIIDCVWAASAINAYVQTMKSEDVAMHNMDTFRDLLKKEFDVFGISAVEVLTKLANPVHPQHQLDIASTRVVGQPDATYHSPLSDSHDFFDPQKEWSATDQDVESFKKNKGFMKIGKRIESFNSINKHIKETQDSLTEHLKIIHTHTSKNQTLKFRYLTGFIDDIGRLARELNNVFDVCEELEIYSKDFPQLKEMQAAMHDLETALRANTKLLQVQKRMGVVEISPECAANVVQNVLYATKRAKNVYQAKLFPIIQSKLAEKQSNRNLIVTVIAFLSAVLSAISIALGLAKTFTSHAEAQIEDFDNDKFSNEFGENRNSWEDNQAGFLDNNVFSKVDYYAHEGTPPIYMQLDPGGKVYDLANEEQMQGLTGKELFRIYQRIDTNGENYYVGAPNLRFDADIPTFDSSQQSVLDQFKDQADRVLKEAGLTSDKLSSDQIDFLTSFTHKSEIPIDPNASEAERNSVKARKYNEYLDQKIKEEKCELERNKGLLGLLAIAPVAATPIVGAIMSGKSKEVERVNLNGEKLEMSRSKVKEVRHIDAEAVSIQEYNRDMNAGKTLRESEGRDGDSLFETEQHVAAENISQKFNLNKARANKKEEYTPEPVSAGKSLERSIY